MCAVQCELVEKIVRKKPENGHLSHSGIAEALNFPKSAVTYVLKTSNKALLVKQMTGSGRKKGFVSQSKTKEVVSLFRKQCSRCCKAGPYVERLRLRKVRKGEG